MLASVASLGLCCYTGSCISCTQVLEHWAAALMSGTSCSFSSAYAIESLTVLMQQLCLGVCLLWVRPGRSIGLA